MTLESAPDCIFTYNRLKETKKTIAALQDNSLALETNVFIFSDAPKDNAAKDAVTEVRSYIKSVTGFKNITIIEKVENFGLDKSIVTGVTQVINDFGSVIVLEDDLLTSQNFLNFMNDSIVQYKESENVWSVFGECAVNSTEGCCQVKIFDISVRLKNQIH
jgi:GT2 family glycosyltransferase